MKYLLIIFSFGFYSCPIQSQTLITKLLFDEAHSVFKGKVSKISYEESNGEGSSFAVTVNVERFYKGAYDYPKVGFGVDKADAIDLELDTMIMDYRFQIEKDKSYFFFTHRIVKSHSPKKGWTKLVEGGIEGIAFTEDLQEVLSSYRTDYMTSKNGPSVAFSTMMSNVDSIVVAEVKSIKPKKSYYQLKLRTLKGIMKLNIPRLTCVCEQGVIKNEGHYIFYTQRIKNGKYKLIDEWVGTIEMTDYEKNRYKNGLRIPYFEDRSILGF